MKAWFLFALFLTPAFALADSIEIRDIEEGEGPELVRHDTALVHYVGRLEEDGSEFDSSRGGQPLSVTIGSGQTIPGFEQAVKGMREGGKREAIIPPNATLRFELEVVEVQRAPFSSLDNEGLAEKLDEGVTIVDIRRPDEWAETGVVEGSHRITAFEEDGSLNPEFGSKFTALVDSDDEVILICRVGNRTSALAQALSEGLGYDKIYNVTDGIMEWLDDDRVVRHDCPDHEETAQC